MTAIDQLIGQPIGQLIDGVSIRMGGRDWIVPALTFGQIKRLRGRLEILPTEPGVLSGAQIDAIIDVVHAALARNYPAVTVDEVGEHLLDLGNMATVIKAIMTGSGLVPSGEAEAGTV
jgi:hypothetical protein